MHDFFFRLFFLIERSSNFLFENCHPFLSILRKNDQIFCDKLRNKYCFSDFSGQLFLLQRVGGIFAQHICSTSVFAAEGIQSQGRAQLGIQTLV